jgi:hypothetical protein
MLGLVASGLIDVSLDDNGDWLFKLNENGIKAGKMMGME